MNNSVKCRSISTLSDGRESIIRVENSTGNITLTEYDVFQGIKIVYKDVHMLKYTPPDTFGDNLLEISHCREGRFEQYIGGQYFYLSTGDLSVNRSPDKSSEIYFPTSHYHGVTVVIDPKEAPDCLSCLLDDVNVKPSVLFEKFCSKNDCFIIRSNERLEHIFSELYSLPENIKMGYFKVKVLELLLFLSSIEPGYSHQFQHGCTQSQVKLAKNVCSYVCSHISSHITIEQLSEHFRVSPTHLKNSFRSVYGSSVYAYVKTQKMLTAARLIRDTDRTILDIAGECGYDNGSKFSKAFTSVMGTTPSSFRKKNGAVESLRLERKNDF